MIRWAASWALYWAGDRVDAWLVGHEDSRWNDACADLYQRLMRASSDVQGDTDNGPWRAS